MRNYYVINRREKRYFQVRAFRVSDVRLWALMRHGITRPLVEDDQADIPKGFRQSSLTELPFNFREQLR